MTIEESLLNFSSYTKIVRTDVKLRFDNGDGKIQYISNFKIHSMGEVAKDNSGFQNGLVTGMLLANSGLI